MVGKELRAQRKYNGGSCSKKIIDWDRVGKLLEAGCLGTEIAPHFQCCADTLYDRCLEEKGITFSQFSREKKSKGDSLIREVQFDKALEGEKSMLIWLGKQRLKQSDDPKDVREFNGKLAETLDLLKKIKPELVEDKKDGL